MMTLRLAWRNIWRHSRRTWLTVVAIAFAATLLIFSITIQLGAYDMMIDNTLRLYTGHLQVQREGYLDSFRVKINKGTPPGVVFIAENYADKPVNRFFRRGESIPRVKITF